VPEDDRNRDGEDEGLRRDTAEQGRSAAAH
jgi:hypothetical protein